MRRKEGNRVWANLKLTEIKHQIEDKKRAQNETDGQVITRRIVNQ